MLHPDPDRLFPLDGDRGTVFLKPLLATRPDISNVEVGEYSYYSDFADPLAFLDTNIRYNFGFSRVRLVIGRFCAIAHGAKFIMADANHVLDGISSFPFPIFGASFAEAMGLEDMPFPQGSDTIVGHDVWFGYESLIMPGVRIGNGAIIGAHAVVTGDVPDYAIMAGNPARVVKMRFPPEKITRLLDIAWWNWPVDRIARAVPQLVGGDVEALAVMK